MTPFPIHDPFELLKFRQMRGIDRFPAVYPVDTECLYGGILEWRGAGSKGRSMGRSTHCSALPCSSAAPAVEVVVPPCSCMSVPSHPGVPQLSHAVKGPCISRQGGPAAGKGHRNSRMRWTRPRRSL